MSHERGVGNSGLRGGARHGRRGNEKYMLTAAISVASETLAQTWQRRLKEGSQNPKSVAGKLELV